MRTIRRVGAVLALGAVLATWGFVSSRPTPGERAERLLNEQIAALEDPEARAATIAELRSYNPEWDFMHRTFLALVLVDRALAHPEEQDRLLPLVDALVQSEIADQAAHGDTWFLLPYATRAPFEDPTGRSVFVDGEIALVLGARRFVQDDPVIAAEHRARVAALVAQFERSPGLVPESYPDEAWLFCNTNALVAIRMADVLDGTDHQDLIDRWVANARAKLIEPRSGLLGSEFTWSGDALDGPEGSSVWLVATNLRLLDPAFAEDQYRRARAALVRDVFGFGYAREWGPSWRGVTDVDSGPLVPVIEASPSSSGFAILAAQAFGDQEVLRSLVQSLGAADLVTTLDPRLAALAANPMGDVIVLHGLTFGPLWEKVGAGRPIWSSPDLALDLDARWDPPLVGVGADGRKITVHSCAERLAMGVGTSFWEEYREWTGSERFLDCFATDVIRRATPARVSHVADFRLDPEAIDVLPPTLGWTVYGEAADRAAAAEERGESWSSTEPSLRVSLEADGVTLRVAGEGYVQTLELVGRGDFDGDGVEDLVLTTRQSADGGSLQIVAVQVVGRAAADGPMRVLRTIATGG